MKALQKYDEEKKQREFNTGIFDTLRNDPHTSSYIPVDALNKWNSMNPDKQAGVLAGVARRTQSDMQDLQRQNIQSEMAARTAADTRAQQELALRQADANYQPSEQDRQLARGTGNELLPAGRGRFQAVPYADQPGAANGGIKIEPYVDPTTGKPVDGYGIVHGKGNQFQIVYTGNAGSSGPSVTVDPQTGIPFYRGPKGEPRPLNLGNVSAGAMTKLTAPQPAASATPGPAGKGKPPEHCRRRINKRCSGRRPTRQILEPRQF
jgi:hypothetical protein